MNQELENCVVNLTLRNFEAAATDLKRFMEDTKCDEQGVTDGNNFVKSMMYVVAEFERKLPALRNRETARAYCDCLIECFRCLRNCSAKSLALQSQLGTEPDLLKLVRQLLSGIRGHCNEDDHLRMLSVAVQFLCNVTVGLSNHDPQSYVWEIFHTMFRQWLQMGSSVLANYTCFLIQNCLLSQGQNNPAFLESDNNRELLNSVVQVCLVYDNLDCGILAIEKMMQISNFLETMYKVLNHKERMFVMEVLGIRTRGFERKLSSTVVPTQLSPPASKSNIIFMADYVCSNTEAFQRLKEKEAGSDENLLELVKMVEILAITSAFDAYERLRDAPYLLRFIIDLLKDIHETGKNSKNMFSVVNKVASIGADVDLGHPGYGIRRDIMRIIGNMVFRCKPNQDLVRTVGGLPVILEQTIIDDRNPFIPQWTVLAIRNLCEENLENVSAIDSLKIQGVSDTESLMENLGIAVDVDKGRVVVKSVTSTSSSTKDSKRKL